MKKTNLLFTLGIVAASVVACDQNSIPSNSHSTEPSTNISGSTSTNSSTSGTISPEAKENLKTALEKAKVSVSFNGSITSIYVEDGDNSSEGDLDITITD